ncbi:hypothetical protein [Sediminitomix flava]|uniref:Caspase domain-containing protein n=1 Tax=Sediminitomix flava TaxID=379075 RepID=A0A315YR04_SEDFL|nr:hypothetical protein [Sediminitomix flava]PWJ30137.1 hypothetical protein BC781_1292 [Sediminitomix flava]
MEKKVILIVGHPNNVEEGKRFDYFTSLYKKYFMSIAGGAFEGEDILEYKEQRLENIESELSKLNACYVIVVLIGHGGTKDEKHVLKLNNNEIIFPGQLSIGAQKQLYIVESCRNIIEGELPVVDLDSVTKFKKGGVFRLPITREEARERFERYLQDTDDGIAICMSCSNDQSAYGFYFSSTLLTVGHNWHNHTNNYGRCLGISDTITEYVAPYVVKLAREIDKDQEPKVIGDNINYPFSICKY